MDVIIRTSNDFEMYFKKRLIKENSNNLIRKLKFIYFEIGNMGKRFERLDLGVSKELGVKVLCLYGLWNKPVPVNRVKVMTEGQSSEVKVERAQDVPQLVYKC